MKFHQPLQHLAAIALTCLSLSCIQNNRPYWTGNPNSASSPAHRYDKSSLSYQDINSDVIAVEFDDQGDFWDRTQMGLAIEKIRKGDKPPLVVTFLHGWKNNSKPDCGNFTGFSRLVQQVKARYPNQNVIGIYMGWRGASSNIPLVKEFTFWNRKSGAARVADGSITYALQRIGNEARSQKGRSILIGHSFGGRIVEKAVADSVIAKGQNMAGKPSGGALPADFIVLINPATESLGGRQLQLALETGPSDPPSFVAIGASNDRANGSLWPLGLSLYNSVGLGFLSQPDRSYVLDLKQADGSSKRIDESQYRTFIKTTTTNNPILFTHTLKPGSKQHQEDRQILNDYYLTTDVSSKSQYRIPEPTSKPYHYGYWVFQVPTNILNGHSNTGVEGGIFSSRMNELVKGLIVEAKIFSSPSKKLTPASSPKVEFEEPKPKAVIPEKSSVLALPKIEAEESNTPGVKPEN